MNVQQQAITADSYTFLFRTLLMLIISYFYKNVSRNMLAESWQSITPLCLYGRVVINAHADSKINVQAAFSAATIGARNENFNQVSCYKVLIRCDSLLSVLSFLFSPPLHTKCLPAIIKQLSLYNWTLVSIAEAFNNTSGPFLSVKPF